MPTAPINYTGRRLWWCGEKTSRGDDRCFLKPTEREDIEALAYRSVGSVEAKYYQWMCLCFFAHVRGIHINGTFAVLFLDVAWVRGRHTLYGCNRSTISRRIIPHCDIESNASKTTFGHLWKSALYTHRANTAFVTWHCWKHPECPQCCFPHHSITAICHLSPRALHENSTDGEMWQYTGSETSLSHTHEYFLERISEIKAI